MSVTRARPLIAVVDRTIDSATPAMVSLTRQGYRVRTYPHPIWLMREMLDGLAPAVVLLGSNHPVRYTAWTTAARLHEWGYPVLMLSDQTAALTEIGVTWRGRYFIGAIQKPISGGAILTAVAQIFARTTEMTETKTENARERRWQVRFRTAESDRWP